MPLNRLQRAYEERRLNLIETLQKGRDELKLSKQHQLYGAIREIEQFLRMIDDYRQEQLAGTDFELKREGERPLAARMGQALQRMGNSTKGFFSNATIVFNRKVIGGVGRVVKGTKRRISFYRAVAKEVKARNDKK